MMVEKWRIGETWSSEAVKRFARLGHSLQKQNRLTLDVTKICDCSYQRIVDLSPYHRETDRQQATKHHSVGDV